MRLRFRLYKRQPGSGGIHWKKLGIASLLFLASCASVQKKCAEKPWLLCGDRIEVHKDYVFLDDPAFLYHNKTVALYRDNIYSFRLGLFFNPYHFQSASVTAEIHFNQKPPRADSTGSSSVEGSAAIRKGLRAPCRLETSRGDEVSGEVGARFARLDSTFIAAANVSKERVTLRFLCRDYQPQWGREDTLILRFAHSRPNSSNPNTKSGEDSTSVLALPFSTSFHGPVYSFAIGAALLVSLTAVGELLATGK